MPSPSPPSSAAAAKMTRKTSSAPASLRAEMSQSPEAPAASSSSPAASPPGLAEFVKILHQLTLQSSKHAALYAKTILKLQTASSKLADPIARQTAQNVVAREIQASIAQELAAIATRLQTARDVLAATPQNFDAYIGEPFISNEQFDIVVALLDDIAQHHANIHGYAARFPPEYQTKLVQRLDLGAFHALTDSLIGDIHSAYIQNLADLLGQIDTARDLAKKARETVLKLKLF